MLTTLVPGDPEARGLAALIELSAARAPARTDASGRFVPLAEQDPALWDQRLISRGHEHLRAAHARGQLGRFQLEAAIQAVHCARNHGAANHEAANHGAGGPDDTTDWPTLLTLHRILHAVAPSLGSGVALAAVTAEVAGPPAAWRHSTRPGRPPASSSRPEPSAPTCLTGSDATARPPRPMKARSA